MSEKLKLCPFCGSKAGIYGNGHTTMCDNEDCEASIEVEDLNNINIDRAIEVWNTRVSDKAIAERDKLLNELYTLIDDASRGISIVGRSQEAKDKLYDYLYLTD